MLFIIFIVLCASFFLGARLYYPKVGVILLWIMWLTRALACRLSARQLGVAGPPTSIAPSCRWLSILISTDLSRVKKTSQKESKMKFASFLLCLLPCFVSADRETAFNIKSVSCTTNSADLDYASCGYGGEDPCAIGDKVTLQGTYTVSTTIPQDVEVCGKVKVFGIGVYDAGCQNVDVCDYIDW